MKKEIIAILGDYCLDLNEDLSDNTLDLPKFRRKEMESKFETIMQFLELVKEGKLDIIEVNL